MTPDSEEEYLLGKVAALEALNNILLENLNLDIVKRTQMSVAIGFIRREFLDYGQRVKEAAYVKGFLEVINEFGDRLI